MPNTPSQTPLKHLSPGWYAVVMGLCGLALAWQRARPLMGDAAGHVALLLGGLAGAVFAALALATLLRAQHHPQAWADDCRHPVRHTLVATLPIALILLAAVAVAELGPGPAVRALWWAGALAQLATTVWVLARWWRPPAAGGLQWASATPALFLPIVGNVLVPLAGVPLGHADWSAAQLGIGVMFWPVVLGLIVARIAINGLWPDRLLPSAFIFIAPPAAVGLALLQLGAPLPVVWGVWGMALFALLWVGTLLPRIAKLPFSLAHWGMSFPLASLAALTLRLATPGDALAGNGGSTALVVLGPVLLAFVSLVVLALLLGTVRGLRDRTLLAPEPLLMLNPVRP